MLHYNPQHVSSSTLLIFRRTNCIITASGTKGGPTLEPSRKQEERKTEKQLEKIGNEGSE